MASGTFGAEEVRAKPRWNESSKVYTRKIHKTNKDSKSKNATDNQSGAATTSADTAVANTNADTAVANTTATTNNENENNVAQTNETVRDDSGVATTTADDSNIVAPPLASESLPAMDANFHHHHQQPESPNLLRIGLGSDDSSSFKRQQGAVLNVNGGRIGNGSAPVKPVVTRVDDSRVSISLSAARPKQEVRELKRKLMTDLHQVRNMAKKLDSKEVQLFGNNGGLTNSADVGAGGASTVVGGQSLSQYSTSDGLGKGGSVRVNSEGVSAGFNDTGPFGGLSVSVIDSNHGVAEIVEKEKRTPKANQFYKNSDFVCGKDKFPPAESNKKLKSNVKKKHGGGGSIIDKQIFKKCASLLQLLMKHKHGWVFNAPVDVQGLCLRDYYDIIRHPMDLGTVKDRLNKNWYKTPLEFAEDVRLTFGNAMTYNPEGQDVHIMAVQLSHIFEQKWAEIEAEYNSKLSYEAAYDMGLPTPTSRLAPIPFYVSQPPPVIPVPPPLYQEMKHLDRSESFAQPVQQRLKPVYNVPVGRTPAPKKPKAKDPDKRDMTFEEKQRLSTNLQALPPEKLDIIVQIIRKRNSSFSQHDDEIEVDIDSVDAETLWELDRFVTNYKKTLNKHKRKAELALQKPEAQRTMQATNSPPPGPEAPKETTPEDNTNVAVHSPVEEGKQTDDASGSSSSSSSSSESGSSSTDSDSDSSSGSGSDGGE